tara:strand:- start:182 stop:298 length:117 start_codon:yes stop_codon:yes gene_type:complete
MGVFVIAELVLKDALSEHDINIMTSKQRKLNFIAFIES